MLSQLADKIDNLNDFIGRVRVVVDVGDDADNIGGYFLFRFFSSWLGMVERVGALHARRFIYRRAAYALRHDAHVRIDIFIPVFHRLVVLG